MPRFRFFVLLAACLAALAPVQGEDGPDCLPPSEDVPRGVLHAPSEVQHAQPPTAPQLLQPAPAIISPVSPPTMPPLPTEFAGGASWGGQGLGIASVHEFDRPPRPYSTDGAVCIRATRFAIEVVGLDPANQYRLLACFDGETVGETDWVVGRDSYDIPTQIGFPPGRYGLTVHAVPRDALLGSSLRTPPVLVDYQPTYLRNMQRLAGRDITKVARPRADSFRDLGDEVQPRQVQVRFVGLHHWHAQVFEAGTNQGGSRKVVVRGRRSFAQGRTYQLELRHDGYEILPTLELPRTSQQTAAFLDHSSIAVEWNASDFDYVRNGGQLTKVMYLPNRADHPARAYCVETLVARCPGDCSDPVAEAARYGTILAILRVGDRRPE